MEGGVCSPAQLIELTKLLGPGNPVLNQLYLKLVDTTVRRCYETRYQLDDCRQLIWHVFSHPAFCATERSSLLHWVDLFDRLFPNCLDSESGYSSGSSDRSSSCSPSPTQDKMFVYNPNFLLQFPPAPAALLAPQCRRNGAVVFRRSQSEPAGHNHHQGGLGNYMGTRCKLQPKERGIDVTSHMTALMSWLKTLRLHKYYPKMSALTYDAMLILNEETLRDITEGARRKILLNVQKLGGRHGLLVDIMGDLSKPGRFNPCITELHNMLMKTPFRLPLSSVLAPHPDVKWEAGPEELIVQYTAVLETAGNIILANNIEEDCQKLFFKLLEDAAQHAAFPEKQRRVVCEILQQCIDNYNYRNAQVIQLKRFDLKNFPHSVRIKYPIKPMNGINHHHQTGSHGYAAHHHVYNKFNRPTKINCQQSRGAHSGHMPLCQSHSAPVAPPSYNHFPNSIWSPPNETSSSVPNHPSATHSSTHPSVPSTHPSASSTHPTTSALPAESPPIFKLDGIDCPGLESLCSQIAECALAEK